MLKVVLAPVISSRGPVLPNTCEAALSTLLSEILQSRATLTMKPGTLQVRCYTGWVLSGDLISASRISVMLNCHVEPLSPERARIAFAAADLLSAERLSQ